MSRKGVQPRNHMAENVAQLRELEAAAVARKEHEAAVAEHRREFKLKQFEDVPSKLAASGVSALMVAHPVWEATCHVLPAAVLLARDSACHPPTPPPPPTCPAHAR
jgi:hypothetical protein